MQLNSDFRDLLLQLNAESVEYIVIGAYAMAAHGIARYTGDIDILYRPELQNVVKVLKAISNFGINSSELTLESLLEPDSVFYFGHPPFRIDLLNSISGVQFEEAWENRVNYKVDDIETFILSLSTIEKNKQAAGRLKDLADIQLIQDHINKQKSENQ